MGKNVTDTLSLYEDFEIKNTEELYHSFYSKLLEIRDGRIKDINNILSVFNRYNELISGYKDLIEIIPSLNANGKAYEKLCFLLIECLNKKTNNRTIGNALIANAFECGRILTNAELIYDSYKQYQKVGLNKIATIVSGGDISGLANPNDYSVQINTGVNHERNTINKNDPNRARDITVMYLWILRHEFRHISQFKKLYDLGVDDELNKKLWELDLYLHKISPALYAWYHDSFPLEYDADIAGYSELINDLENDYKNDKSLEISKDLAIKIKNRKDNYSIQTLDELIKQLFDMNYLVQLPQTEKVEFINKINEIYELMKLQEESKRSK